MTLIITSADKEQTLQGNEKKKSWQIDCRVCSFILFFYFSSQPYGKKSGRRNGKVSVTRAGIEVLHVILVYLLFTIYKYHIN